MYRKLPTLIFHALALRLKLFPTVIAKTPLGMRLVHATENLWPFEQVNLAVIEKRRKSSMADYVGWHVELAVIPGALEAFREPTLSSSKMTRYVRLRYVRLVSAVRASRGGRPADRLYVR